MSRRALILGFCISLGINGLLGGILLGSKLLGAVTQLEERPLLQIMRTLPPEMRRPLFAQLHQQRDTLHTTLKATRAGLEQAYHLSHQDHLDQAALQQSFNEIRQGTDQLQQIIFNALGEALAQTPPHIRQSWQPPKLHYTTPGWQEWLSRSKDTEQTVKPPAPQP